MLVSNLHIQYTVKVKYKRKQHSLTCKITFKVICKTIKNWKFGESKLRFCAPTFSIQILVKNDHQVKAPCSKSTKVSYDLWRGSNQTSNIRNLPIRAVIEERLDGALSWRDLKTKDKGNMNGSDSDKIEILKVETKKLK